MTGWIRLELDVPRETEDRVVLALGEAGVPGWEEVETSDEAVSRYRLWVLAEDAEAVRSFLAEATGAELTRLSEESTDWQSAWAPERVGRFVIGTVGAPDPDVAEDEILIRIVPAMAFGGGEHPTTRQVLTVLPDLVHPGQSVLDVGCGSGVLSVAAARLGASPVHAVDVDPVALGATSRAAEASGVEVRALHRGLDEAEPSYPLVLANILAPVLIELAPQLLDKLPPGGRIVLAGIRAPRRDDVLEAYHGLRLLEEEATDGWVRLLLERAN